MHIADGIIPIQICIAADGAALGALYLLGKKTTPEAIPRMGFMGSALFVISLIHFPLAGTSIHLGLLGLAGILLGLQAIPVIITTLLFQALFLQHGGLITVGLNAFNMCSGSLIAMVFWQIKRFPPHLRSFAAGFSAILAPAILMAGEFYFIGYGKSIFFLPAIYAIVAVIEGILTMVIINFLYKTSPSILKGT